VVFREDIEYTFEFLVEAVLHSINFIFRWGMNFRAMISHQWSRSVMYDILFPTDRFPYQLIKLYQIHDFHFLCIGMFRRQVAVDQSV
jgi:hypothetical protein